jgi:hypothetical protein
MRARWVTVVIACATLLAPAPAACESASDNDEFLIQEAVVDLYIRGLEISVSSGRSASRRPC